MVIKRVSPIAEEPVVEKSKGHCDTCTDTRSLNTAEYLIDVLKKCAAEPDTFITINSCDANVLANYFNKV